MKKKTGPKKRGKTEGGDEGERGGGQRPVNKKKGEEKWRRLAESIALNLVPGVCASQTAPERHRRLRQSPARVCRRVALRPVQVTFIYRLFMISGTVQITQG